MDWSHLIMIRVIWSESSKADGLSSCNSAPNKAKGFDCSLATVSKWSYKNSELFKSLTQKILLLALERSDKKKKSMQTYVCVCLRVFVFRGI